VQDFAHPFVEIHEVPVSLFFQPAEIPVNSNTAIWCISHSSQFCVIGNRKQTQSLILWIAAVVLKI